MISTKKRVKWSLIYNRKRKVATITLIKSKVLFIEKHPQRPKTEKRITATQLSKIRKMENKKRMHKVEHTTRKNLK